MTKRFPSMDFISKGGDKYMPALVVCVRTPSMLGAAVHRASVLDLD